MNKAAEYADLLRFIAERMKDATQRLQTYEQQHQQIIPLLHRALATDDLQEIHTHLQQVCAILAITSEELRALRHDE